MTYLDLVSVRNTKTCVCLDILCAFCMKYYTNSLEQENDLSRFGQCEKHQNLCLSGYFVWFYVKYYTNSPEQENDLSRFGQSDKYQNLCLSGYFVWFYMKYYTNSPEQENDLLY